MIREMHEKRLASVAETIKIAPDLDEIRREGNVFS